MERLVREGICVMVERLTALDRKALAFFYLKHPDQFFSIRRRARIPLRMGRQADFGGKRREREQWFSVSVRDCNPRGTLKGEKTMLDRLKTLFSEQRKDDAPEGSERKTHIAACVLLLEAAHADNECTSKEMAQVVATLESKYAIQEEFVKELIAFARVERKKAVDLWQFTNHLNQHMSSSERLGIMTDVWRIIHVDGVLEGHEDHFAHKLGNLLHLTHKQLIEAKLKARENPERKTEDGLDRAREDDRLGLGGK
jgi:uncharacterized tellurite resistance protein B-like protein